MMQTKKLLGLLLLGSFLLGSGLSAAIRKRVQVQPITSSSSSQGGQLVENLPRPDVSVSRSGSSASQQNTSRLIRKRIGQQPAQRERDDQPDEYAGSGSQDSEMAPAAAIAHALEILNRLAQDLQHWSGAIQHQDEWRNLMTAVNNQKQDILNGQINSIEINNVSHKVRLFMQS